MYPIATFEEFQARRYFSLLDGIRAIAILAVLWHHSAIPDAPAAPGANMQNLVDRGYLGVDLFFVLSGFLITHLLIRERKAKGKISLAKFYLRRTLRIFPLYYGYLVALLIWTFAKQSPDLGKMLSSLPYYLLYVSNWMPEDEHQFFHRAWSLAVEEQFYLLWPVLIITIGIFRSALMIAILVCTSLLCIFGLLGEKAYDISQLLVPYRTILLGCLVAILLNTKEFYRFPERLLANPFIAPILLVVTILFIAYQSGPIVGLEQLSVHLLMAAFIISCIVNENNYLSSLLKLKAIKIIGIISYGIYILHGQLWGPTNKILSIAGGSWSESRLVFFLVFTALSTFVAFISFNTYEKFFLNLKKRYEINYKTS
jgi:peptidoglycan/LPS O-acetylase OafA/YrhL